ncbi:hypothetical protein [Streptomyces sp. NPDC002763]
MAAAHGRGAEMHERLLRAHLGEGEVVDDRECSAATPEPATRPPR